MEDTALTPFAHSEKLAVEIRRERIEQAISIATTALLPLALHALDQLVRGDVPKDRAHAMNAAARTILELTQAIGPKSRDHLLDRHAESLTVAELEREITRTRQLLDARREQERIVAEQPSEPRPRH